MNDDFAAVDEGDTTRLVAMMRATDAWPAVVRAREWVLDRVALPPGAPVLDVGSGPGTFSALAARRGATTVDLDRSLAMLAAARRTCRTAPVVRADVDGLPVRDGAAALTRAERVLQWTSDPDAALAELVRVTSPGGAVAVTDSDWGSFRVAHQDAGTAARWADAALGWIPHPRLATTLPDRLAALGCRRIETRRDVVTINEWDPDDVDHVDGPPGLPLRSIAGGAAAEHRTELIASIGRLADDARIGRFESALDLVTVLARAPLHAGSGTQKSVR